MKKINNSEMILLRNELNNLESKFKAECEHVAELNELKVKALEQGQKLLNENKRLSDELEMNLEIIKTLQDECADTVGGQLKSVQESIEKERDDFKNKLIANEKAREALLLEKENLLKEIAQLKELNEKELTPQQLLLKQIPNISAASNFQLQTPSKGATISPLLQQIALANKTAEIESLKETITALQQGNEVLTKQISSLNTQIIELNSNREINSTFSEEGGGSRANRSFALSNRKTKRLLDYSAIIPTETKEDVVPNNQWLLITPKDVAPNTSESIPEAPTSSRPIRDNPSISRPLSVLSPSTNKKQSNCIQQ